MRSVLVIGLFSLAGYGLASYVALPALWKFYEARHPALALAATRALAAPGIPGDPINLAFIGTEDELMDATKAADWLPADPITWVSSAKFVLDSAIHRAG